jgi:hypothetical protein
VLTGQAKTDYQREYMRKRRSNRMKPDALDPLRPHVRPVVSLLDARTAEIKASVQYAGQQPTSTLGRPLTKERQTGQKGFNE